MRRSVSDPLPATPIDPPTLKMTFGVNDSSLGGREGKSLTGRQIWDRLVAEAETNVALRVLNTAEGGGDKFEVQGRGELHLGVLIETCLLYTSPSPRDLSTSRMPSSA